MDCAEGTYSQLADHCDQDLAKITEILKKTQVIFLTHIHGDH